MFTELGIYLVAASRWRRSIWTAMVQVLDTYTRGNGLSLLLVLAEPIAAITMLYVLRGSFKGALPNYGTSLFLFYASGFLPFYLFIRVSSRARSSKLDPRWRPPGITVLDMYLATTALNALIWLAMTIVIFSGMFAYGISEARPASIVDCVIPLGLFVILGLGVGMLNNVLTRYFSMWSIIYAITMRGLIFFSGVLYVADLAPLWLRNWIVWNPLLHGIEWFRVGVYGRYPHLLLDKSYLVEFSLIALFLGMVVDRASVRALARA